MLAGSLPAEASSIRLAGSIQDVLPATRNGANILFLTHTGRMGGAEMCLLTIAGGLHGDVLLFDDGPLRQRLLARQVSVSLPRVRLDLQAIRRDRGMLKVLPALAGIGALIRQIRQMAASHDLVYCNSQKSFVIGALASWFHRTPLLWHLHDILDRSHFGRLQISLVTTLANRCATCVVAPSRAVADAFVAAGGRAALVKVIANGVEPPAGVELADREALRRSLDLPEGPLFGVFSRLSRWKGQQVALQALVSLPDAACIIAGDALFGEEEYARSLWMQAEQLGIANRVYFLGHRDDVAMLMRAVDVVVHPSIDPEPFGLTLVEAMLTGTPVIASDAGAASEILDGGRFGTLVPPGDAAGLAAALATTLHGHPGRPNAILRQVAAARCHAETHFSAQRLLDDIRCLTAAVASSTGRQHQPVGELP